jgi:adenine-specific DNA-methyltransferase
MIYPRLWLSRNLLKDDGVIFVSIDDDEVANLRKVMDEIYGEENFVAQFVWKKRTGSNDAKNLVSADHEYIVCYSKYTETQLNGIEKEFENYKNPDKDPLGDWTSSDLTCNKTASERPNLYYPITDPASGITYQCNKNRVWAYEKMRMQRNIDEGKIIFPKNIDGSPMYKRHKSEVKSDTKPIGTMLGEFLNATSTKALRELLGGQYFDYPKNVNLIKILIKQATNENDLILDFFAGSGTTAHAVMDLNKEDGGNRKYILVQLPEATDEKSEAYKAGYKKISEITKERLKRVIKKLDYKDGFKSYYLDNSNFQIFKELKKRPNDSLEKIEKMLKMSVFQENILTQGAKELDLVYEVGLKNGFTLSAKIEIISIPKLELGNEGVSYNFTKLYEDERAFYFCFNKEIQNDIIHSLPKESKLICYEKALSDSVKLNLHSNIDLETL